MRNFIKNILFVLAMFGALVVSFNSSCGSANESDLVSPTNLKVTLVFDPPLDHQITAFSYVRPSGAPIIEVLSEKERGGAGGSNPAAKAGSASGANQTFVLSLDKGKDYQISFVLKEKPAMCHPAGGDDTLVANCFPIKNDYACSSLLIAKDAVPDAVTLYCKKV